MHFSAVVVTGGFSKVNALRTITRVNLYLVINISPKYSEGKLVFYIGETVKVCEISVALNVLKNTSSLQ